MGLAENQLSFNLLERWLYEHPNASICTKEGVPNFREIVNYQDYHGLPNCRKEIGMFMEEVRGRKAKFDTERIVLTARATAAHEVLAFCLADPGFWNFCHAGRSAVAVVLLMEYAKENGKCIQCEGNKELYASQCRHLDPICITCATNMAKDKTPCPTCHQVFTKIFRQNKLKPCPDGDTNKFLSKFPPKLSDSADFMGAEKQNADNKYFRKSDKRKWIMYREGAEEKRNKSKIATRPWILENVMDKKKYKGKEKPVDNKMYYMVQFDYKRMSEPLVVYPIKSWYEFETEIQYKTLTEEAENIMKSRKKNEQGYAKWISNEKMKKDEMEDADENDETRKQKQLKKEDDSDQDEEEKKLNPDENDLPKGEDWEHEEEFTDDDLSASSEALNPKEFLPTCRILKMKKSPSPERR